MISQRKTGFMDSGDELPPSHRVPELGRVSKAVPDTVERFLKE